MLPLRELFDGSEIELVLVEAACNCLSRRTFEFPIRAATTVTVICCQPKELASASDEKRPCRMRSSSVRTFQLWMERRREAEKLCKKSIGTIAMNRGSQAASSVSIKGDNGSESL